MTFVSTTSLCKAGQKPEHRKKTGKEKRREEEREESGMATAKHHHDQLVEQIGLHLSLPGGLLTESCFAASSVFVLAFNSVMTECLFV